MTTSAATTLAEQINAEHDLAQACLRDSLSHALRVGELLLEARESVPHGSWLAWLEENCAFSARMAQNYMRLARKRDDLSSTDDAETATLSVRDAIRQLAEELQDEASDERSVHFSSDSPEWYTPPEMIERVVAVLGSIDLDPCSNTGDPNVPAARHFTAIDDGLSRDWSGKVFMNPPYGREIGLWVSKLRTSFELGHVKEALALVPSRTDAAWFAELRSYARCFLRGRLKFIGGKNSAPFPSMTVYLGQRTDGFAKVFETLGDVYVLLREHNAVDSRPSK